MVRARNALTMKILFLHGWHSTPGGRKPRFLEERGHQVANPALCPDDFALALKVAQESFEQFQPEVVVGSSRGGALAMNINADETPLVLMCPAWKHWGESHTVGPKTLILHSLKDEVIPFEHSEDLVQLNQLPKAQLKAVGFEHRLACDESLQALEKACLSFQRS